jgi:hypothetical protein
MRYSSQFRAEAFNLFNHPNLEVQTTAIFESKANVLRGARQLWRQH